MTRCKTVRQPVQKRHRLPPGRAMTSTSRKAATSGGIARWNTWTRIAPPAALDSEHPLFILYTSGSTGKPKGILHTTGGYLLGAYMTCKYVFDLRDEDVYWCTADIGWVTGPQLRGLWSARDGRDVADVRRRAELARARTASGRSSRNTASPSFTPRRRPFAPSSGGAMSGRKSTISPRCACSARSASRSIPRRGCGITTSSAAGAARSWTRGGRPKPAAS